MDEAMERARKRYEVLRHAAALAHRRWKEALASERAEAASRYADIVDLEYEALRALEAVETAA
jgi:hypothetical protein